MRVALASTEFHHYRLRETRRVQGRRASTEAQKTMVKKHLCIAGQTDGLWLLSTTGRVADEHRVAPPVQTDVKNKRSLEPVPHPPYTHSELTHFLPSRRFYSPLVPSSTFLSPFTPAPRL